MPTYHVEVYELHAHTYEIEAETMADAVIGVRNGDGISADDGEYIETADKYSLPLDIGITIEDANKLSDHGIELNRSATGIYGIRDVTEY